MEKNDDNIGKGFLITCDKNKEKQAIKDSYNFLSQYIQQLYGDLENEQLQEQLLQKGKQLNLKNQLQARAKLKFKILSSVDTKVNCLIFIRIHQKMKQIDPIAVVNAIMEDVHKEGKIITRFCHKIMPVEVYFKAQHFRMLDEIDSLFQKRDNSQQKSWALNFKCRNNSKFNYKQIVGKTDQIAKKYGHFVDIYYPQWTVSIQIVHHLLCISIVENYKQYSQFRLHKKSSNPNSTNIHKQSQIAIPKDKKQKKQQKRIRKDKQRNPQSVKDKKSQSQQEQQQNNDNNNNNEKRQNNLLLEEKIEVNADDDCDFI